MPAIHSKLSKQGEAKIRHQKLKHHFPDTHMNASLMNNLSSKCPRQTEANHLPSLDFASPLSNISNIAPQEPVCTLPPKCIYKTRGRGRPSGGSRHGRRGRPRAGQATAQDPGDGAVNGGGDRRDRDGAGRRGDGCGVAGPGGGRRGGDGGGRRDCGGGGGGGG